MMRARDGDLGEGVFVERGNAKIGVLRDESFCPEYGR